MANRRSAESSDLHTQVRDLLLDKVRSDPYPSTTHLDMLEAMLEGDDDREVYAEVLMDKVRDEAFPSLDHLRRLQSLS